jgi:hypothetical protein
MLTRFDHAVIGVRSLDAATASWNVLGFDARPGGRHTGRGTHNAIVRFGLDYIELISVCDRSEVESRGEPNALALTRLIDRAEGGLLGYAVASDDIEADGRRLRQAGFAIDGPTPMQRLRPDGRLLRWRLLVPRGGSWGIPLPFIIQWDDADTDRLTWERPGAHHNGASAIAAIAIVVADLDPWIDVYSRQLGLELLTAGSDPELGAKTARFRIGSARVELLSPTGPGPIAGALEQGERPWQLTLLCRDVPAATRWLRDSGVETRPAPGSSEGVLIPPEAATGARVVLVKGTRG